MRPVNVHGTAIVIGTTGFLFVGPSGSGKSSAAFDCLAAARASHLFAALVSDDQVMITRCGSHIVGRPPAPIAGLIEVRGAGVVETDSIEAAILRFAVMPVAPPFDIRIAPEHEMWTDEGGRFNLPLVRLPCGTADPFGRLCRLLPQIPANPAGKVHTPAIFRF